MPATVSLQKQLDGLIMVNGPLREDWGYNYGKQLQNKATIVNYGQL